MIFLIPVFILTTASCNLEKRLYRNGWYIEKNKPYTLTATPGSNPVSGASAYEQYEQPVLTPGVAADSSSVVTNNAVDPVTKSQAPDSSLSKEEIKKMSRRELVKSMKAKGCAKPNESANILYWLAVVSICFCLFPPLSILLALVVLLICPSAEKEVIAKGECPRENLALINKARWMARGLIFITLLAFIALFALVITLIFSGI